MYHQIQSIPTAALFLKRGGGAVVDYGRAILELDYLHFVLPQSVNSSEDSPLDSQIALQQVIFDGPWPVTSPDETGASALLLQSSVFVLADQISETEIPATSSLALQSAVWVLAQQRSETEPTPLTSSIALQSATWP